MNQDSPEVREAFHSLHTETDKSKSSQKSLVHIIGFAGTTPRILLFLALSRIKTFQREMYSAIMGLGGWGVIRYPHEVKRSRDVNILCLSGC